MRFIQPNEGACKVFLFPDCRRLTVQDQNVLLKLVEEGPGYAAFLFCAENPGVLLPTVRSRCVELAVRPTGEEEIRFCCRRPGPCWRPWPGASAGSMVRALVGLENGKIHSGGAAAGAAAVPARARSRPCACATAWIRQRSPGRPLAAGPLSRRAWEKSSSWSCARCWADLPENANGMWRWARFWAPSPRNGRRPYDRSRQRPLPRAELQKLLLSAPVSCTGGGRPGRDRGNGPGGGVCDRARRGTTRWRSPPGGGAPAPGAAPGHGERPAQPAAGPGAGEGGLRRLPEEDRPARAGDEAGAEVRSAPLRCCSGVSEVDL